jgi:O-antigen/teichoic acid export membrane protein
MIARSAIASDLDWNSVGIATALWRVSDWVLFAALAVLYFHFLPLLSKSADDQLQRRLIKVILQVFIPSVLALLLLFFGRQMIFPFLYSSQLEVNWKVCLLFWIGDAMRVLAIIFLMALYISYRTRTISVVELFSQPLLALLLTLGAAQSLIWVSAAHLFTYTIYASFCFLGVLIMVRTPER